MNPPMVPWINPHFAPDNELMSALRKILRSGRVTNNGPMVAAFESAAAKFLGVEEVIAVSNGSDALLLSAYALGGKGRAILPSFTFMATLSAVVHNGLIPVFCDVEPDRWTMSPRHLETLLRKTKDVALIVPVNSFGVPPDLPSILSLASSAGAKVLYDDAHGFGSKISGFARCPGVAVRIISLHATKVLPAVEGGLIICEDRTLAKRIRQLRSHGLAVPLEKSLPGFNARMDELRAAVGLHSLRGFRQTMTRRRRYAQRLRAYIEDHFRGVFINQQIPPEVESNYTNLAIRIPAAEKIGIDAVIAQFQKSGVETRRYFYPALHQFECFRERRPTALPVTERLALSLFCLPLHSLMKEKDLRRIESALRDVRRMVSS